MRNNNLICYLFTRFDSTECFIKFIKFYKKYPAGSNHSLLICFKLLDTKKIISLKKLLKKIRYIEFIDPILSNDYDFGHSYPVKKIG